MGRLAGVKAAIGAPGTMLTYLLYLTYLTYLLIYGWEYIPVFAPLSRESPAKRSKGHKPQATGHKPQATGPRFMENAHVSHGPAYHPSPRFRLAWHYAYLLYLLYYMDGNICIISSPSVVEPYYTSHRRQIQDSWFMIHDSFLKRARRPWVGLSSCPTF